MEEEIELLELIQILLKRKWWIVLATLLAAGIALAATLFAVEPVYQADTTLIVNGSKGSSIGDIAASFDLGSVNLSQKLVVTYSEIVKSRIVLEQVIERLGLEMTYRQLLGAISASPVNSTEILKISVKHSDPEQAAEIANMVSDVFIKEVSRILKVDNVEIIDAAIPMYGPVNVRPLLNTAIGGVLGAMLSVFVVFLLHYMDRTIKSAEDISRYLELQVLGAVVDFNSTKAEGHHSRKRRKGARR